MISQKSWRIDGVSGHFHSTDGVTLDIWFPRENASSKILASFSYKGANGAIVVMGRRDRRILQRMKKTIEIQIGKIPWVAVVLRRTMSIAEKATKALHAIRILSNQMKEVSLTQEVKDSPKRVSPSPPIEVAGKPSFKVDKYGFIVLDSTEGIPLFAEDPHKKKI